MKDWETTLAALEVGQRACVVEVGCGLRLRHRLEDLGLVEGTAVRCLHRSPSGSPTAYCICGSAIALRREDACRIRVRVL